MIRKFILVAFAIHSSVGGAVAADVPLVQRQAALEMMKRAHPVLDESECGAFVEDNVRRPIFMTREDTFTHLVATADLTATATLALRRASRNGEVERARDELREVTRALLRAAQINAYQGSERVSRVASKMATLTWMASVGSGLCFSSIGRHFDATSFTILGVGFVLAGGLILNDYTRFSGRRNEYRFPFSDRIANRADDGGRMRLFWSRVTDGLRKDADYEKVTVTGVEQLMALIERDLRGISMAQACRSALVLEARSTPWP